MAGDQGVCLYLAILFLSSFYYGSSQRVQGAEAEHELASRRLQCSQCRLPGHNARTCPMLKGVQAVVDPNTSARVRDHEIRTVMQGVGVYTNEATGNSYYRAGLGPRGAMTGAADVIPTRPSQPDPAFGTQPTEGDM